MKFATRASQASWRCNMQSSPPDLPTEPENVPNTAGPQQGNLNERNETIEEKMARLEEKVARLEEEKMSRLDLRRESRKASRIRMHEQQIAEEEQGEEYPDTGECERFKPKARCRYI